MDEKAGTGDSPAEISSQIMIVWLVMKQTWSFTLAHMMCLHTCPGAEGNLSTLNENSFEPFTNQIE